MKKIIVILFLLMSFGLNAQSFGEHSIEHEFHQIGVFNPQWEIEEVLNPVKYEHLTGYFRDELASIIFSAVEEKKVKIYNERKREISLDSVINNIISFEKEHFNINVGKDTVLSYIKKYVSAYQFEEFVDYSYKNVSLNKKIKAYCPYLVRYKSFNGEKNDSVQLPLFWIFPEDAQIENDVERFYIYDTILSVHSLKYPVQMPFASSLFSKIKNGEVKAFKTNGDEFATKKDIDNLFFIENTYVVYDEETEKEISQKSYSDIVPEDIIAIRIGENWSINPNTLEIFKVVQFYLPLYKYDEEHYSQLGVRIYNKSQK
ncbi:MAG: hypothetical protein IKV46_08595 [Bacteroidales bacterium]|nr:hypothetical protein [Bacteroidales bacterium]